MTKKPDCNYPNCTQCKLPDCDKEQKDIAALLKRRRYRHDPQKFRDMLNESRAKKRAGLPNCYECDECVIIKQANKGGYTRLCVDKMQIVEQKVSNSPRWCKLRQALKG